MCWSVSRPKMPPQVDCVAVFPASDRVVSGSRENTLKLWDAASNECLATWEGHSDYVRRRGVLDERGSFLARSRDQKRRRRS